MTFVPDLARATGLSSEKAERVAGTLLSAVQMSAPSAMYAALEKAIPGADGLMLKSAPPLGGRTGEMRAYVNELRSEAGAARLSAQLSLEGLTPQQIKASVEVLLRHLQDARGVQAVEELLRTVPGLQRLLA